MHAAKPVAQDLGGGVMKAITAHGIATNVGKPGMMSISHYSFYMRMENMR